MADFHFVWLTGWTRWRPFSWLHILSPFLVSPQLHFSGTCPSRLLDRASQYTLFRKAALIGCMRDNVTLTEISWTRRSEYTWTSFRRAIGLLGTLCRAYTVTTGLYGLFCHARCLRLLRNAVIGMVESFLGWLGPKQEWQRLSHHSRHRQFHSCCRGTGYIQ